MLLLPSALLLPLLFLRVYCVRVCVRVRVCGVNRISFVSMLLSPLSNVTAGIPLFFFPYTGLPSYIGANGNKPLWGSFGNVVSTSKGAGG
jgi:hypothetical protein